MIIALRQIERWLHQHIFKVGWLLTQNFQTTTILYYTFFLPGIVLHEFVYWLAAGILDVRAERAIQWPEPQEIGELKLNFIQLERRTGTYQRAMISVSPLIVGTLLIWFIANNILDINTTMEMMASGDLGDVGAAIGQFTGTPDFWLWIYVIFTISNTMFPVSSKDLKGWQRIAIVAAALLVILIVLGVAGQLFSALAQPLSRIFNTLQAILLLMISVDLFVTLVLGTIEWVLEHVTGNSATFKKGKMITMTREEAIEYRTKERERERRRAQRARRNPAADTGPPSIYSLPLPVPGPPGEEPVSQITSTILGIDGSEEEQAREPRFRTGRSADLIAGSSTPAPAADAGSEETPPESPTEEASAARPLDDIETVVDSDAAEVEAETTDRDGGPVDFTPSPALTIDQDEAEDEDETLEYVDIDDDSPGPVDDTDTMAEAQETAEVTTDVDESEGTEPEIDTPSGAVPAFTWTPPGMVEQSDEAEDAEEEEVDEPDEPDDEDEPVFIPSSNLPFRSLASEDKDDDEEEDRGGADEASDYDDEGDEEDDKDESLSLRRSSGTDAVASLFGGFSAGEGDTEEETEEGEEEGEIEELEYEDIDDVSYVYDDDEDYYIDEDVDD